MDNKLVTKCD